MRYFKFIIAIGICLAAGFIGSTWEPGQWYQTINKPAFTPPNAVFPIVWTILYIMMGISAGLVWMRHSIAAAAPAFIFFGIQLILNIFWSYLFFGLHRIGWALVEIIFLWLAILITTVLFWKRSIPAGILLLPYLLWVTFAAVLNFSLWILNR